MIPLQPIDPSNNSIKIPKIKFDMKKADSDSDVILYVRFFYNNAINHRMMRF